MEKAQTLTDLLTDLEQAVRECRILYSKNETERIENEIKSDEDYKSLKCEWQAAEASRAYFKNEVEIRNETIAKQQRTIRLLRRKVRHLRSLLKTKDRLLHAQKTFYEEMNRYSDSRMKEDVKNIESTITECLERVLINGAYTV